MTPVAPARAQPPASNRARRASVSAQPPASKTGRRASVSERPARGRRRILPGAPRGGAPRRISGPAAAPAQARLAPRRATSEETFSERLGALLRSLPDHPLLDRVVRGRAWIPILGVMLVGIVAMQVELLKLNASTGRSIELISSLQSRNDGLRAQVAAASDPGRIERLASHMGMTMPGPESITFLRARSASVRRALAGIHVPDLAAFQAALNVSYVAVTPMPAAARTPASGGQDATTSTSTAPPNTNAPATQPATNTPTNPNAPATNTATNAATTTAPSTTTTAPPAIVP